MAEFKKGDRVKVAKPGAATFGKTGVVSEDASYLVVLDGEKTPRKYGETSLDAATVTPPPPPTTAKLVVSGAGGSIQGANGQKVTFARAASTTATASGYEQQTAPGSYKGTAAEPYIDAEVPAGSGKWQGRQKTTQTTPPPVDPPPVDPPPPATALKKGFDTGAIVGAGLPAGAAANIKALGSGWVRSSREFCTVENVNFWKNNGQTLLPCWSTVDTVKQLTMLDLFEWGNEPYFGDEGSPDPGTWAKNFVAFAKQAKAARPNVRLLIPVSVGPDVAWMPGKVGPDAINAMFTAAPDLGQWMDGWSIHPYCENGPASSSQGSWLASVDKRLDVARQAFVAHGVTKPGFITEFGYSGDGNNHPEYATQLMTIFAARPWMEMLIWYKIIDHATAGTGDYFAYFGVYPLGGGWTLGPAKPIVAGIKNAWK